LPTEIADRSCSGLRKGTFGILQIFSLCSLFKFIGRQARLNRQKILQPLPRGILAIYIWGILRLATTEKNHYIISFEAPNSVESNLLF